MKKTGLSAVRLLEEIELMGYRGSVDTVRRYLKTIDEDERVSSKATVRYETAPGRQAQADWAEIGRMPDENGVMKNGLCLCDGASSLSDLGEFSGGVSGLSQICGYFLVNSRLFTGK